MNEKLFSKPTFKGWVFFILAGIFFLYEFFCRASFAAIAGIFEKDLHLTAAQAGFISSSYFLSYAFMQIPVGILVDRFGVRKMGTNAIIITSLGALIFSLGNNELITWIGRFIIGIGASFGFVLMFKIILSWFPHKFLGFMGGMTQILGIIGPLLAGVPLVYELNQTNNDWSGIFKVVAISGFLLAFLYFLIVRDQEENKDNNKNKITIKEQLSLIIKNKQAWTIAIYIFFAYASIEIIGSLFGIPYLQSLGYSRIEAASVISFAWLGLGLGSPIIGLVSDYFQNRKYVLMTCSILGSILIFCFLWLGIESKIILSSILFLLGCATGCQALSFGTIVENTPKEVHGTIIGFNNMFVLFGASMFQIFTGDLLSFVSKNANNAEPYEYQIALSLGIVIFMISFIISFFIKETNCKQIR